MTLPSIQEIHEGNRTAWNEAAQQYRLELAETIEFIAAGKSALLPAETELLGSLGQCGRAIHLQCASGKDTLSLWNLGHVRWLASTSASGISKMPRSCQTPFVRLRDGIVLTF